MPGNTQSDFVREICAEESISLNFLSQGYVIKLTKDDENAHIFGSYWDINSAAADRIACDKTACFLLLSRGGIPAVSHELFSALRGETAASWARAEEFFDTHKKVVIKPNNGTKGMDIFLCDNLPALEAAASEIFTKYHDAALSPFVEIGNEYRVFFLCGQALFVYGKTRGDSRSWQHNLSKGALAFEVADDADNCDAIKNLAIRAADCIGINFATIDIAVLSDGSLAVMEINSGVQARQLLEQLPHLRPTIKGIYAEAIRAMF